MRVRRAAVTLYPFSLIRADVLESLLLHQQLNRKTSHCTTTTTAAVVVNMDCQEENKQLKKNLTLNSVQKVPEINYLSTSGSRTVSFVISPNQRA